MAVSAMVGLVLIGVYTIALGIAEFRRGNHLGGIGLTLAALAAMTLGTYEVYYW
jgi:hypothetical protein